MGTNIFYILITPVFEPHLLQGTSLGTDSSWGLRALGSAKLRSSPSVSEPPFPILLILNCPDLPAAGAESGPEVGLVSGC